MKTIDINGHNFRVIGSNSPRRERYIDAYSKSNAHTLRDVYGKFSDEKDRAYIRCVEMFRDLDGMCLRIIGYNTCFFTVGFTVNHDGAHYLVVITVGHDYIIKL